jgi:hypothetical protein
MTFSEFIRLGLFDELVERVPSATTVRTILDQIGFPHGARPGFPNRSDTSDFWRTVCRSIEGGVLRDGPDLQPLVDAAAARYPGNPVFQRYRDNARRPPEAALSASAPQPGAEIDVFLSYNRRDENAVGAVFEALRRDGVRAWMDRTDLHHGRPFATELQRALECARVIAVFVGVNGLGRWQELEVDLAIDLNRQTSRLIFPIALGISPAKLPPFLRVFTAQELANHSDVAALKRIVSTIRSELSESRL